jgi:hypothetical protein
MGKILANSLRQFLAKFITLAAIERAGENNDPQGIR